MAIPDRPTARRVLASVDPPEWLVAHLEGVARVATAAARALEANGVAVDVALVEAAARLHDIDKLETPAAGRHGQVAAERLTALGYAELADAVASHPVTALLETAHFPRGWEAVCVAVADRRVGQTFVTIEERLDAMSARHPAHAAQIQAAWAPADALEADLAEAAGLSREALEELMHQAWAGPDR